MSIVITINGTDRTDKVRLGSLKIKNVLTKKRDTCNFIIEDPDQTYEPAAGQEVVVTDNGTKIFGGVIVETNHTSPAYAIQNYECKCQDYTRLLDRKLVPDTYENQTIDAIIADLQSKYFPSGFTINNVSAPVTVKYVGFNYKPLAKVIEELAELVNYDWYVDYDKDLHFFAKNSEVAPFDLADDDGSYEYGSLVVRRDNSQVRNTVVVRGGEYLASQRTVERESDGLADTYHTLYKFTDFEASVTGQSLDVGVFGLNQPDEHDALYDFNQKLLIFKAADKPSAGASMKFAGKPNLPVIVRVRNTDHIATMMSIEGGSGVYEYLIEDKSLNTKEGARQRGKAEIAAYGETLSEGQFVTETSGLRAGQQITVNSASKGLNESFIINKVQIKQRNKDVLQYHVSLITTRTFDLIDILQRLLLEGTKKIEIGQNETIDIVLDFQEEMLMADEIASISSVSTAYTWEADPPTPQANPIVWDYFTWE